ATIEIGSLLETKIQAFKQHTSQAPLFAMFENATRQRGEKEAFHLAASIKPGRMTMETDLFEGVNDD
ncbi:MAG: hypothetical protein ACXWC1_32910, partial [Burkholderiales bacterium]